MGNICGKTEPEPFAQPGRPLGSAPPPGPKTSRVPPKVGGPPRTLGGAAADSGGGSSNPSDARRRAAEAAEYPSSQARAKASSKGGKLQSQLTAQKKQNRSSTLAEASNQELRARDADEAAKARNWE
ncbi:hypothetical protein TARUN_6957 [Trichoderma arundinaceum]|uniref:Uncharacterized protein n=1 Tax=Trichoderma arundinaceum TaxID=490622 RepID=A0A395NHJ9_TRIAR|nr:hypothetical protein TARUN_6957 [Trichoderma arundinaceum]